MASSGDDFTYGDLHKELVEEAQLLLKMALETAGKGLTVKVDPAFIRKLQDEYHTGAPLESTSATSGRARISCG